jgi:hypothetical protein
VLASRIHTQEGLNLRQHHCECIKSHILVTAGPKFKFVAGEVSGTYEGAKSPAFSFLFTGVLISP